ncbi:MAG TPA: DUF2252 family protein, partial [Planctomycetaceae bacterium]|nr:DUF2252 family protein [Planctomycetaceae bacterium]
LHSYPGRKGSLRHLDPQTHAIFKRAVKKARDNTHARLLPRVAQREAGGSWRFIANLPTLSAIDDETASKVVVGLREYVETLTPERRYMMKRYRLAAVARRVVGVGSVGLRAYLALFFGNGESDPLFLQVKETTRPALADYVAPLPDILSHNGRRVVFGQRFLQASIDVLLGWTTIEGRHFFVRQMRNMKGSIPIAQLNGSTLGAYSRACGALLCRAHARTADIAKIAGYCGSSDALDQALADFAERYGDQNERDHAALVEAIKQGRVSSDS